MDELVTLLKGFECHFNWKLEELSNDLDSFACVQDKVIVKNEEVSGQPWRHIVLDSVVCYEESKNSPTLSDQKIHECMLSIASEEDPFVKKHRTAIEHVFYAFKAHVALLNLTVSKAQELAKKVLPLSEMSPQEKAGVMGFKATVILEYGKEGTINSLEWAREAVKLDPTEGEWHFLVGKIMQRIRNFSLLKVPSEEERMSLEKAFELSKAPHCAIFLASCLSNVSKLIFYGCPLRNGRRFVPPKESEEMKAIHERCVTLLKLAAEGNPACPHNLIRVARGFFYLPGEYKNLGYAQKLVDVCIEKAPDNPMVMIVAAQISDSLRENEKALKYAKKAGELGAYGGYIKYFEFQVNFKKQFDEEALYEKILSLFKTPLDKGKTYLHAASYYLFVKNDHLTSFEYFKKALEVDYDLSDTIKSWYVCWIRVSINMYDIMYNEAALKITSLKEEFGGDHPKLTTPRYLLFKIAMISPPSSENPCDPNLLKRFIDNADSGLGRGRGGSRGIGRGRGGGNRARDSDRQYMTVSLSADQSWRGNRSGSSEQSVKVKSGVDRKVRSESSSSDSSSESKEDVRRGSARIRRSSGTKEQSGSRKSPTRSQDNLDSSLLKSKFDELVKITPKSRNIRRADLEAMMNIQKHGADTTNTLADQSAIPSQPSPTVSVQQQQQGSSTEPEHIELLKASILKTLTDQEPNPPPVEAKEKNDLSKSLDAVSSNLQRLDLSNSSEGNTNPPTGANDILTSFIKRKIASEKIGDDSSSDESADSD